MSVNLDKPHLWKEDVRQSVDFYNRWFMDFAPEAYREQRTKQAEIVEEALKRTDYLRNISHNLLKTHPSVVTLLRAATAPPIARDRLAGLAYVTKNLIESMEGKEGKSPRIPPMMKEADLTESLDRIAGVIEQLADRDLLVWLDGKTDPEESDIHRTSTVLADRLCGAAADPIIRNAQEKRQLALLRDWLERRGYEYVAPNSIPGIREMKQGTFTFHLNVSVSHGKGSVNIPVDVAVMSHTGQLGTMPLLIEAKSAGDFTNTNKRRKEEAQKATQLRYEYGTSTRFILFLCGYFGADYLGYMAAEGVDWIWEHRVGDLDLFDLAPHRGNSDPDGNLPDNESGEGPDEPPPRPDPTWNFTGIVKESDAESEETENQRLDSQTQLDINKSPQERNRLGQFATPPSLAQSIVREAMRFLPPDTPIRFLDPSIGTGSFFSALLKTVNREAIEHAAGVEIDPTYAEVGTNLWKPFHLHITNADFTRLPPPAPDERFNIIIANPPYVRHHHISTEDKKNLRAAVLHRFGVECSGLSGLYSYFILLAHDWMRENGIATWLVPTEFMDVGYGKSVRDYLARQVTLLRIHRFAAEDMQFDDAIVSSAVLFFKNAPAPSNHTAQLTYGGTLDLPRCSTNVPVSNLYTARKWNSFFTKYDANGKNEATTRNRSADTTLTLGNVFTIKRGLATGANNFFILSRAEAEERELPREFLRPVLPSPRYVNHNVISARADGSADIEKDMVLLACNIPESEVQRGYPTLWEYLQEGKDQGIAERYLCSKRNPWYAQERRTPAPILCSYMGRGNNGSNPLRFFLNSSNAIATNVYLNLYPRPPLARLLLDDPTIIRTIWQALGTISAESMAAGGRVYGGGLHKAEPNELAEIHLPGIIPEVIRDLAGKQSELIFQ